MEDSEVVAAIVAGDPGGLAEAYDKYAVPLHAYCRSMLRDPGKLRAWLYAVARNICHRRLRAGEATSALEEAAEVPSETSDLSRAAERAELSGLVQAASPTSSSTAPPPASASPSPTVAQGTLTVAPSRLVLAVVNGKPTGAITLTAVGGPVTGYAVTVGSAAVGKLTVSPSSGSLASGASVTITVTSTSLIALDATLTINPGGHAVTVVLALTS
jgi:hypothetical protein